MFHDLSKVSKPDEGREKILPQKEEMDLSEVQEGEDGGDEEEKK